MTSNDTNALEGELATTFPPNDDALAAEPVLPHGDDAAEPVVEESAASQDDADDLADEPGAVATSSAGDAPSPLDALSPAVRRLVRQYDLDITGIHGTGPSGRIRVGDVIGMLGGRNEAVSRGNDAARTFNDDDGGERNGLGMRSSAAPARAPAATRAASAAPLTTTVFECDLSRVLSHRKKRREQGERLLTSYFLFAFDDALKNVSELTAGQPARFGVRLSTADGAVRSLSLDTAALPAGPLDDRLAAIDAALRASLDADLGAASLIVHQYGVSGSLIATPTPVENDHVASLGIGRIKREIVVRNVDGEETPRIAAVCRLSLSFVAERVTLDRANRFLAGAVRALEQWPE